MGCVYEQQDNYEDALHYFRKVAKQEPGYRDVEDRIAALEPRQDLHARAVNDDEEFDRVFDELFNTK